MTLPLCPCGSGKLYEECCYREKGADGEPLFFKGAMCCDTNGNWHPIPNIRIPVILGIQAADKYRECAKELVNKSKLAERHHKDFINCYGLFYQSYEQLLESLKVPGGKGVSFQMDTIEVREHWRNFLINGRIYLNL